MVKKELPADKQALLDGEGYETYNRDVIRKVFPRVIKELKTHKPLSKAGDVVALYFALLTNINGQPSLENGERNPRFSACFMSQQAIVGMTGIGINRVPTYVKILVENGLLFEAKDVWEGTNRYIYYYPSYCPKISDDGYIVNGDGEKVVPNYGDIADKL